MPCTAIVITLNEAAHIEACLASVAWADERIVVIDEDLGLSGAGFVARSGFARLTAGAKVTVTNAESQPANSNEPVAEQPRQRRQGGPDRRERRSEASPGVVR